MLDAKASGCRNSLDFEQPCNVVNASDDDGERRLSTVQHEAAYVAILVSVAAVGQKGRNFDQVVQAHAGSPQLRFDVGPDQDALCMEADRHRAIWIDRNLTTDVQ